MKIADLLMLGASLAVIQSRVKGEMLGLPTPSPTVPPNRYGGWRERYTKSVVPEFRGKVAPDLSRQEARTLMRKIAKLEAHEAKVNGKEAARLDRKSRRAQKARAAHVNSA
jgi:hypothetical protein